MVLAPVSQQTSNVRSLLSTKALFDKQWANWTKKRNPDKNDLSSQQQVKAKTKQKYPYLNGSPYCGGQTLNCLIR